MSINSTALCQTLFLNSKSLVKNSCFCFDWVAGGLSGDGKSKSRKEVMAEIVAKSKMYKAERAKQKEDDLKALNDLDSKFAVLLKSSSLKRGRQRTGAPEYATRGNHWPNQLVTLTY